MIADRTIERLRSLLAAIYRGQHSEEAYQGLVTVCQQMDDGRPPSGEDHTVTARPLLGRIRKLAARRQQVEAQAIGTA